MHIAALRFSHRHICPSVIIPAFAQPLDGCFGPDTTLSVYHAFDPSLSYYELYLGIGDGHCGSDTNMPVYHAFDPNFSVLVS